MTRAYQWYYDGASIGGATSKTHTLTSGQTDQDRIECRTQVDYGADSVAALAEYPAAAGATFGVTIEQADSALTTNQTTVTYSAVSWTDAGTLIIPYGTFNGGGTTLTSITADGETATTISDGADNLDNTVIEATAYEMGAYQADVTSSSGDVVFTFAASLSSIWKGVLRMTGGEFVDVAYYSAITGANYPTGDIDVVAGGALFAFAVSPAFTGGTTDFTNLTADVTPGDVNVGAVDVYYALETGISTTETRTITGNRAGSEKGMMLISMGPA